MSIAFILKQHNPSKDAVVTKINREIPKWLKIEVANLAKSRKDYKLTRHYFYNRLRKIMLPFRPKSAEGIASGDWRFPCSLKARELWSYVSRLLDIEYLRKLYLKAVKAFWRKEAKLAKIAARKEARRHRERKPTPKLKREFPLIIFQEECEVVQPSKAEELPPILPAWKVRKKLWFQLANKPRVSGAVKKINRRRVKNWLQRRAQVETAQAVT